MIQVQIIYILIKYFGHIYIDMRKEPYLCFDYGLKYIQITVL